MARAVTAACTLVDARRIAVAQHRDARIPNDFYWTYFFVRLSSWLFVLPFSFVCPSLLFPSYEKILPSRIFPCYVFFTTSLQRLAPDHEIRTFDLGKRDILDFIGTIDRFFPPPLLLSPHPASLPPFSMLRTTTFFFYPCFPPFPPRRPARYLLLGYPFFSDPPPLRSHFLRWLMSSPPPVICGLEDFTTLVAQQPPPLTPFR